MVRRRTKKGGHYSELSYSPQERRNSTVALEPALWPSLAPLPLMHRRRSHGKNRLEKGKLLVGAEKEDRAQTASSALAPCSKNGSGEGGGADSAE